MPEEDVRENYQVDPERLQNHLLSEGTDLSGGKPVYGSIVRAISDVARTTDVQVDGAPKDSVFVRELLEAIPEAEIISSPGKRIKRGVGTAVVESYPGLDPEGFQELVSANGKLRFVVLRYPSDDGLLASSPELLPSRGAAVFAGAEQDPYSTKEDRAARIAGLVMREAESRGAVIEGAALHLACEQTLRFCEVSRSAEEGGIDGNFAAIIVARARANAGNSREIAEDAVREVIQKEEARMKGKYESFARYFPKGYSGNGRLVFELGVDVFETGALGDMNMMGLVIAPGRGRIVDSLARFDPENGDRGGAFSKGNDDVLSYLLDRYPGIFSLRDARIVSMYWNEVTGASSSAIKAAGLEACIAGVPILENFAGTGAIGANGLVEHIGGVNEKIEAAHYIFKRNRAGENSPFGSVIIPRRNLGRLALPDEVAQDVRDGNFRIYAVDTIEEYVECLTGKSYQEVHAAALEKNRTGSG
ncbi:MAG: hypothetical protein V1820_02765 [archaeon]